MVDKKLVEESLLRTWLGEKEHKQLTKKYGHDTLYKAFSRANRAVSGGFSRKRILALTALQFVTRWRKRMCRVQSWLEAK